MARRFPEPRESILRERFRKKKPEQRRVRFHSVAADTVPWDKAPERTVEDRLEAYQTTLDILGTVIGDESCPPLETKTDAPMHIISRLGNEVASSNVFRVGFRDYPDMVAVKILPHTNYNTDPPNPNGEKSKQEVALTLEASNAVLEGKSSYFPIRFGSGGCDDVVLPRPSSRARNPAFERYRRAREWAVSRKLIEDRVHELMQALVTKQVEGKDPFVATGIIEDTKGSVVIRPWTVDLKTPLRGELIVMEMAWGDLSMYIDRETGKTSGTEERGKGKTSLHRLIHHCIRAIIHLQSVLRDEQGRGILHRDLVAENVFVQKIVDKDGDVVPWPLIGDFGDATRFHLSGSKRNLRFRDVVTLFESLLGKRENLPNSIARRIETMLDMIDNPRSYDRARYGVDRIEGMNDLVRIWNSKELDETRGFGIPRSLDFAFGELGGGGGEEDNKLARFLV